MFVVRHPALFRPFVFASRVSLTLTSPRSARPVSRRAFSKPRAHAGDRKGVVGNRVQQQQQQQQGGSFSFGMAAPGSTVILSGGSAGGIGAFGNVDFVAGLLPDTLVLGAPVGGFPPELNW